MMLGLKVEDMITKDMKCKILKAMDKTARECINDENYMEYWLAEGVPDDSTDEDFEEWAENNDDFNEFIKTFAHLIDMIEEDPDEMSREEFSDSFIKNLQGVTI